MFDINGVPEKNYFAVRAFAELLKTSRRVEVTGGIPARVLAGLNTAGNEAAVLVSNLAQPQSVWRIACTNLPWRGSSRVTVRVVDEVHDFAEIPGVVWDGTTVRFTLRRPAVALISLRPESLPAP